MTVSMPMPLNVDVYTVQLRSVEVHSQAGASQ